jgi:hypothetical protein
MFGVPRLLISRQSYTLNHSELVAELFPHLHYPRLALPRVMTASMIAYTFKPLFDIDMEQIKANVFYHRAATFCQDYILPQ